MSDVFLLVDLCLENLYFLIKPIILTMHRQKRGTNPPEIETQVYKLVGISSVFNLKFGDRDGIIFL